MLDNLEKLRILTQELTKQEIALASFHNNLERLRVLTETLVEKEKTIHRQRAMIDRFFLITHSLCAVINVESGIPVLLSTSWIKGLGYPLEELYKTTLRALMHPDDQEVSQSAKATLERESVLQGFRARYRHKDGHYLMLEWNTTKEGKEYYSIVRIVGNE